MIAALAAILLFAAPAGTASPQTTPLHPGISGMDQHRWQADQHRYEMDRLRAGADQREAVARQLALETRLNRQRLEAARQPEPVQPLPMRALRSPGEERALRRSASERRAATAVDLGQIDAWLDRPRD